MGTFFPYSITFLIVLSFVGDEGEERSGEEEGSGEGEQGELGVIKCL